MYPEKQSFFILGLSRSGKAASEFLLAKNATVFIYDDMAGERVESVIQSLEKLGAKRVHKENLSRAVEVCDVLVLSPGIPIDHPLAVSFKRKGKAVVGETELASPSLPLRARTARRLPFLCSRKCFAKTAFKQRRAGISASLLSGFAKWKKTALPWRKYPVFKWKRSIPFVRILRWC